MKKYTLIDFVIDIALLLFVILIIIALICTMYKLIETTFL